MLWCLVFKVTRRSLAEASALATRSFAVACILAARALAASFFARNFCLCCAISRAARSFCARFLAFAASRAALALSTFTCSSCFFWARITSRPVAFSQASCLPEALYSTMAFLYSAISASNLVLYWSFSGAGKVSHFFLSSMVTSVIFILAYCGEERWSMHQAMKGASGRLGRAGSRLKASASPLDLYVSISLWYFCCSDSKALTYGWAASFDRVFQATAISWTFTLSGRSFRKSCAKRR
mmetsp:Transcript_50285/g.109985  ORF Transcript_50285/g.109985 Transcript_50285/m.109985 type:complete len:240 (-) Transcript_50285:163-882(-)